MYLYCIYLSGISYDLKDKGLCNTSTLKRLLVVNNDGGRGSNTIKYISELDSPQIKDTYKKQIKKINAGETLPCW